MGIPRVTAGFRLHGAPHMDGIDETDPKRRGSQSLGVLGFVIMANMQVLYDY